MMDQSWCSVREIEDPKGRKAVARIVKLTFGQAIYTHTQKKKKKKEQNQTNSMRDYPRLASIDQLHL